MEITENKLRQYLLRNLPDEEAEQLDIQIINDESLEEAFQNAEESLMEEYLEGMLSPSEARLFHENFLGSSERESELKHLFLLKRYAKKKAEQEQLTRQEIKTRNVFFRKLKSFFGFSFPLPAAVIVLIVLGLLLTGVFFYKGDESEIAALNQNQLNDISQYKNLSNLSLSSGTFREAPSGNALSENGMTENVLLRLALPSDIMTGGFFNIKITSQQKTVATLKHIRSYDNQNGRELRLLLPSAQLKKGSYKIEAAPENGQEAPVLYTFTIQ
jgi:hypothetical protein